MKKLLICIAAILFAAGAYAQAPQNMSYQAVVRNSNNTLVTNASVGLKISLLQGSTSGTVAYAETHTLSTNANGLVTVEIGSGSLVAGDWSTIDWSTGIYFIQVEIDPTGGTNYTVSGASKLLSVPYALYAENSGSSIPGPQGPIGLTGPQGPAGLDGVDGATGPQGVAGAQGPIGLTGPQGPAGLNGIDGVDGATGPQGPIGLTGPQGPAGLNGVDGVDGATGPQGPIGLTGPQGPAGLNGIDGVDGTNGIDGLDGATGPMGPQGPAGLNGVDGINGTNGIDGLDGATGPMGPQGPAGLNGIDGINGTNGIDGINGINGLDGATGPMGPQGPAGNDGLDGATGPMGPQGPAGLNGIDGNDGLDGATGPMGPQGPAGLNGIDGINGLDGATGPMGPQGPAGLNGIDGINGLDGATGPMGPQGPAGLNGIDGINGLDGATGPMGPQGPAGNDGLDGATGPMGPQGPAGLLTSGSQFGNTPYWNGGFWVTNSNNLFNNGGSIGIGTSSPGAKLDVVGNVRIADGTQGDRKVLMSDGNGNASWNKIVSGYVLIGDVASGISTAVGGDISFASKSNSGSSSTITVNFDDQGNTNFVPMISLISLGTADDDNDVESPVILNVTSTSFDIFLNETNATTQDLRINVILMPF